ncbi:hypothetical protein DF153_21170 [Burkholderia cenocepacia]|nr:hypothetical protein DF152_12850 [Burkholderia cenocepacia]RQU21017.1 hypothetical protein DF153_21170 [Burkholderia cenocepacia]
MNKIKRTPGPVGFVNESALKLMLSGESAQCRLSRMKSGRMAYPLFDESVASDALMALELVAAEDEAARHNGRPLLTSGVLLAIDAVLIKAGRKKVPAPVRHITVAGGVSNE